MRKELYPDDWSAIALSIKQEAKWTCQHCHKSCCGRMLNVHHRDRNPANNQPSNLMALCAPCHLMAHRGERYGRQVHPNQLVLQWN